MMTMMLFRSNPKKREVYRKKMMRKGYKKDAYVAR